MSETLITLSEFANSYGIPTNILLQPNFSNPDYPSKDTYKVIHHFKLSTYLQKTQTLLISPNDVLLIPTHIEVIFDRNVVIDSTPFTPNPLYSSKTTYSGAIEYPNPNIGIIDNSGNIKITALYTLETKSNSKIHNSSTGTILCDTSATMRFNSYSVLKNTGYINFTNSSTFSFLGWLIYNGTAISNPSGLLLPTTLYPPSDLMSSIVTVTSTTTGNTIRLVIDILDSKTTGFGDNNRYGGPMHIYGNDKPGPYICKMPIIPCGKIQSGVFTIVNYTYQDIRRPQSVGLSTNPFLPIGGIAKAVEEPLATIAEIDVLNTGFHKHFTIQDLTLDKEYYLYIYDPDGRDAGGQKISYKITMEIAR